MTCEFFICLSYALNICDPNNVPADCKHLAEVTAFQVDDIQNSTNFVSTAITENLLTVDCMSDTETPFNG
jgi:hypothetical protein